MILLATDLDGTLFPNSGYPHSSDSYVQFGRWVALQRKKISLAYITGRHLELTLSGIEEFKVPVPDYIGCDVGSLLYQRAGNGFALSKKWQMGMENGFPREKITLKLSGIEKIYPQEDAKQGIYKISYYYDLKIRAHTIQNAVNEALQELELPLNIILSKDPVQKIGLIDILPAQAGKENMLRFLAHELGLPLQRVLYCGDSGNDLQPISSEFPAVMVANAPMAVKREAGKISLKRGTHDTVFFASKNYVAGILEGLEHFGLLKLPE